MNKTLLAMAGALALAACATATPYQPVSRGGYGYADAKIEDNRARVTFRGNSVTDRQTVENYLLYRAAEVTLENGFDYFVTAQRDVQRESEFRATGGRFYSPFYFDYWYFSPRFGWRPYYDPFFADPISYREVTQFEAVAEIAMFDGRKPQDQPQAYDARQVIENLRSAITFPEARG